MASRKPPTKPPFRPRARIEQRLTPPPKSHYRKRSFHLTTISTRLLKDIANALRHGLPAEPPASLHTATRRLAQRLRHADIDAIKVTSHDHGPSSYITIRIGRPDPCWPLQTCLDHVTRGAVPVAGDALARPRASTADAASMRSDGASGNGRDDRGDGRTGARPRGSQARNVPRESC